MAIIDKQVLLVVLALIAAAACQEACRTPNRRDGQCIPRTQCRSFNAYFAPDRILNSFEVQFLQQSVCSETPPKICCPDKGVRPTDPPSPLKPVVEPILTTSTTTTTQKPFTAEGLLPDPYKYECGLDILSDRIIGGEDTSIEEFPWYALLEYITKKGDRVFDCGGSLINRRYVLTAGHCLSNSRLDEGQKLVNIRLGEHNTATEQDCEGEGADRLCSPPPQNFGIEEIIVHPNYNKAQSHQHHDIGLIRLDRDAELHHYVTPICLPTDQFVASPPGRNVTVTGFGHTGVKRHSGIKRKAKLPIMSQDQCKTKFGSIEITDKQLCAGGLFAIDSCSGDSGGPLMSEGAFWTIEGVVSFGRKCGLEGWPGVYTRVSSYVDWIKNTLRA